MGSKRAASRGENQSKACERGRKLPLFNNPSSNMYEMIEELEKVKAQGKS